jgi:hypothetical protein
MMRANRLRPQLTFTHAVSAELPRPDYRLVLRLGNRSGGSTHLHRRDPPQAACTRARRPTNG